jgi:pyrroloquinoline-quinone synthase
MMEGLGFSREEFAENESLLHPAARAYRRQLREGARATPWQAAVALLTIFVEGSVNERAELAGTYVRAHGEEAVLRHPLVAHYGCPPSAMTLTRAHAAIEGAHRADAWRVVLAYADDDGETASAVERACAEGLEGWRVYRDGVASEMGLERGKHVDV